MTLLGITTDTKEVQSSKALYPMEVIPSVMTMETKSLEPSKAESLMVVAPFGKTTVDKLEQLLLIWISFNDSAIIKLLNVFVRWGSGIEKIKSISRHINKEREAHSSLASLSWAPEIALNVETSNSELHADMIYSSQYTRQTYHADTP